MFGHQPPPPNRPWAWAAVWRAVLLGVLLGGLTFRGGLAQESTPLTAQHMGFAPRLQGQGQLRFWGVPVYEARLWVGPVFEAQAYARHAFALELIYQRAFRAEAIAQRSIEEIRRQRALSETQARDWQQVLTQLLPDVRPGDRLIGVYQPGQGLRLWHGGHERGAVEDAELARLFFGIWLSPQTSVPALRQALLGPSQGAPS